MWSGVDYERGGTAGIPRRPQLDRQRPAEHDAGSCQRGTQHLDRDHGEFRPAQPPSVSFTGDVRALIAQPQAIPYRGDGGAGGLVQASKVAGHRDVTVDASSELLPPPGTAVEQAEFVRLG